MVVKRHERAPFFDSESFYYQSAAWVGREDKGITTCAAYVIYNSGLELVILYRAIYAVVVCHLQAKWRHV